MADGDGGEAAAASSRATEEQQRSGLVASMFQQDPKEASSSGLQDMIVPNPEEDVVPLGDPNDPTVLKSLFEERRWLDADQYLGKALLLHLKATAGAPAAAAPNYALRAHPELFVLLRRQHVLELLSQRKYQEARQYFNDSILEPTRLVDRTAHLDTLLSTLDDTIIAVEVLPVPALLDVEDDRRLTCRDVDDYLRVYFPELNRGRDVLDIIAASKTVLHSTTRFAEVMGRTEFRCLVCHQKLIFDADPNNCVIQHLHDECPAVAPALRPRLPDRNRPG